MKEKKGIFRNAIIKFLILKKENRFSQCNYHEYSTRKQKEYWNGIFINLNNNKFLIRKITETPTNRPIGMRANKVILCPDKTCINHGIKLRNRNLVRYIYNYICNYKKTSNYMKSQGAFFAILNIWYQWKAFIKFLDLPSFFNPCFNFNIT